jgi:mannose-6-phosphate isomerase-like protein (cupin superfamily)
MKVTAKEALAKLPLIKTDKWPLGVWDKEVLAHGTMSLEIFAPKEIDYQTPHEQDELYIIISGRGFLMINGEDFPCEPHDVLFVPAGVEHRFRDFSMDFATWVIFYGAKGGEAQK